MSKRLRGMGFSLLIFVNVFGHLFEKNFALPRQYFLLFPLMIILFSFFSDRKIRINRQAVLIAILILFFCGIQIMMFENIPGAIQMVVYLIVFAFAGINPRYEDIYILFKTIIFVSILMICEALYYYFILLKWGWHTYNVRHFTTAPKEDYTILLSLAFIILFVAFLQKKRKIRKRILIFFLMSLEIGVNIFVMQSKTTIFIILISGVLVYHYSDKIVRNTIRNLCMLSVCVFIFILLFFHHMIPEYIIVFINKYTGMLQAQTSNILNLEKFTGSYIQRNSIYSFCIRLFFHNPISGIGFGEIGKYAILSSNTYVNELTQAESGIVSAFVEGGMLYGVLYIFLISSPIYKSVKIWKNQRHNAECCLLLLTGTAIFTCCVTNDCKSITFWIILGIIFFHRPRLSCIEKVEST